MTKVLTADQAREVLREFQRRRAANSISSERDAIEEILTAAGLDRPPNPSTGEIKERNHELQPPDKIAEGC